MFTFKKIFFKRSYLFIFREGRKEEKERERNTDWLPLTGPQVGTLPATQACALTGNLIGDLSVHRLELNLLSHTSQDTFHFLTELFVCLGDIKLRGL